jgi:two-component system, NarL family, nitrate/nitrite response regulator NarL
MPLNDLRVLIVGDNPLARAGLAALLASQPELNLVGQTAADTDLALSISAYLPDVVIWDMGWDASRAFDQLAEARDASPPVLALLAEAAHAAEALSAGARGVLFQEANAETLASALHALAQGLIILAPELMPLAIPAAPPAVPPAESLTARELEVLALVAEGLPNKTIAARLAISEHTVKFHINAVMSKLGAQSRTEAVVRATRLGMIVL